MTKKATPKPDAHARLKNAASVADTLDQVNARKRALAAASGIHSSEPQSSSDEDENRSVASLESESVLGDMAEPASDLASANRQIAQMRKHTKVLIEQITDMRDVIKRLPELSRAGGNSAKSAAPDVPRQNLIPKPAQRSTMCVDELMVYMGIQDNHERWLETRTIARDITSKAGFDLSLSWGQQDTGRKTEAALALRQAIPEFERFVNNWGAHHLMQDTFNHQRNRILSLAAKNKKKDKQTEVDAGSSMVKTVKVDKRKRAFKGEKPPKRKRPNQGQEAPDQQQESPGRRSPTPSASASTASNAAPPRLASSETLPLPGSSAPANPLALTGQESIASTLRNSPPAQSSAQPMSSEADMLPRTRQAISAAKAVATAGVEPGPSGSSKPGDKKRKQGKDKGKSKDAPPAKKRKKATGSK